MWASSPPRVRTLADAAVYLGLCDTIIGRTWATPKTFGLGRAVCTTCSSRRSRAEARPPRRECTGHGRSSPGDHPQEARRRGSRPRDRSVRRGLTSGRVTEGQAASFAMAVFFRGLSIEERVALTRAMTRPARLLPGTCPARSWTSTSTGGVGDCVSLALAPAVAACGGFVPMISGRGLGHTGGTLDKLDSIPGYVRSPTSRPFRPATREIGCAIIGKLRDLAPRRQAPLRHKRRYRDGRVDRSHHGFDPVEEAGRGLQGLVMDVKVGSALSWTTRLTQKASPRASCSSPTPPACRRARSSTDMNEPVASAAGNAVEVAYCIDYLTGAAPGAALPRDRPSPFRGDARAGRARERWCEGTDEGRGSLKPQARRPRSPA